MTEAGGSVAGFEALYRGLYPLVVRTVYLVTMDASAAQEITHEAFLRLWEHRGRLGEKANEKAWLMRVAMNLAIDHRRSLLNRLRLRTATPLSADPASVALAHLERDEMRRALRRLGARDRAVLALRFDQQLSFREIGQVLGRSEATVKTWVHRAIARLARKLAGPYVSATAEELP